MKKAFTTAIIALAVASAAALTGCSGNGGIEVSTVTTAPTETTAATTEPATAEPATTEPATEAEPTTKPVVHAPEDYVVTRTQQEIPYQGEFLLTGEKYGDTETALCRLPRLTLTSEDAKAINSDIAEKFDSTYTNCTNSDYSLGRVDYICALNGDILSLPIEMRSVDTPNSFITVYNINVDTGKKLTADEVAAAAGTTMDAVYDLIRADVKARCDETKGKLTESGGTNVEHNLALLEEVRQRSLTDENLSKAEVFIDKDGVLNATYRYYWVAGAENYGALLKTNAVFQGQ